jgi:hypothetical protein
MRLHFSAGVFAVTVVAIGSASLQAGEMPRTAAPGAPATPVVAAAAPALAPAPAPPARVGRVSLASGKLEFRGPGDSAWSPASINDPVATGVALRTDPQARGEIRIGADTIDLDGGTEIAVAKLDLPIAEIAVRHGRIDLDIRGFNIGESVQIDSPRGGLWLLRAGRYDIDAGGDDRPVRIAAFTGRARFVGAGSDIEIAAGDRAVLSATGPVDATIEAASADEFAEWCGARAVNDSMLAAPYFITRDMTGYAVLDAAGSWRATDKYGEVWTPTAPPADWMPFRNGHWRWLSLWGWSWVDDQPWGFATSHYGRWLFADGKWSWVPGIMTPHPVAAPAVVAYLGTPGVGLSYADGPGPAIAWFPLAPAEIYWPSYTSDLDYIRAINRANVADLGLIRLNKDGEPPAEIANAHFANREFASVVPRPVFVAGQPVANSLVAIPDRRLRDAPVIMGSPKIGPPPPPAPVRVATALVIHEHPPSTQVEASAPKSASWASIVRAATIHSQHFQEVARLRLGRWRSVAYAAVSRLRHTLVLRIARADHAPLHPEAPKRIIRQ